MLALMKYSILTSKYCFLWYPLEPPPELFDDEILPPQSVSFPFSFAKCIFIFYWFKLERSKGVEPLSLTRDPTEDWLLIYIPEVHDYLDPSGFGKLDTHLHPFGNLPDYWHP